MKTGPAAHSYRRPGFFTASLQWQVANAFLAEGDRIIPERVLIMLRPFPRIPVEHQIAR